MRWQVHGHRASRLVTVAGNGPRPGRGAPVRQPHHVPVHRLPGHKDQRGGNDCQWPHGKGDSHPGDRAVPASFSQDKTAPITGEKDGSRSRSRSGAFPCFRRLLVFRYTLFVPRRTDLKWRQPSLPPKLISLPAASRQVTLVTQTAAVPGTRRCRRCPAGATRQAAYQRPRCTTSLNGRRLGFLIGASGRSAG